MRNTVRQYIGLIHKDADSDYGVSFPDLPGCISAGRDLDEAFAMAEEALAFHLDGMARDGENAPEPSSLEAVMADRENRHAIAILIPTNAVSHGARLGITMADTMLAEVDDAAAALGMSRSAFLSVALQEKIERESLQSKPHERRPRKA